MFHRPSSGLHQPLLQAGQRPVLDSLGQSQPPPQIAQVVGQQAQRQPYLVGAKPMAGEPRHFHSLLPLFDPLLSRTPLVVKPHYRPARRLQVGHDESHSGEQLSEVELHLRHHTSRCLPACGLVEKALVPDHGLVAWPSYGPRQRLRDVALKAVIGGYADGILHASLLQRLVISGLAKAASARNTTSLPSSCWRSISGSNSSAQSSALCTLPGRSLPARQSPSPLNSNSGW